MRGILRAGFFWQFIGGFALGAVGMVTLHPAEAMQALGSHPAATHLAR